MTDSRWPNEYDKNFEHDRKIHTGKQLPSNLTKNILNTGTTENSIM